MADAETVLLHSLEESTMHIKGIFGEATRGATVCGFMQTSPEAAL